jgi:nucleoside phosphorylase
MSRMAIIAAMPGELKPLVRGWKHERYDGVDLWRRRFDKGEWIAACAGAGVDAATQAFAEVEKSGSVDRIMSIGWAGALRAELAPGQAYRVSGVIDVRTGERFRTSDFVEGRGALKGHGFSRVVEAQNTAAVLEAAEKGLIPGETDEKHSSGAKARVDSRRFTARLKSCAFKTPSFSATCEAVPLQSGLWLVTTPCVADSKEKQRLAAAYPASLVDMEAAGVARLAAMRGVLFYCIKGISDGYSDQLPDFNSFISPEGEFQLVRFIIFSLFRPWRWPALIRMGENSSKAARAIAKSVLVLLDEQD